MLREGDPEHASAIDDHLGHDVRSIDLEHIATGPQRRKLAGVRAEFGLGAGELRDSLPTFGPQMNGDIGAPRHPAAHDTEARAGATVRHLPSPARRSQIHYDLITSVQDDPCLNHAGVTEGDRVGARGQPGEAIAAVGAHRLLLRPVFGPTQARGPPDTPAHDAAHNAGFHFDLLPRQIEVGRRSRPLAGQDDRLAAVGLDHHNTVTVQRHVREFVPLIRTHLGDR